MFFKKKAPLQHALRIQILISEVAMISADLKVGA
jgi:hypothetical protein